MKMIWHNIRQTRRRWQWFAALLLSLTMVQPAQAAVQEMRVIGVGVNTSSMKAAEQALDYARKRAVYLSIRKLGVADASKVAAKLTNRQLNEIIRGANVTQTRRDGNTTYVEVEVTIVDEALRRALKLPDDYGKAKVAEVKGRGVLLLSAYVGRERAYLWEKENQLRAPLADEIRRQSHGMVMLPGGDLEDLRLIDYQNVLTVKPEELKPMFARYGAEEIVIAVLTPSLPGTTDASSVLLRRLSGDAVRHEVLDIPVADEAEPFTARLQKVAVALASAVTQIATSTAERDQQAREKATKIKVIFSYVVPKDLATMQEAVRNAPQVLYLDMPSIALARADGTLYLQGDEAALLEALRTQGIRVNVTDEGWRLSVR